LPPSPSSPLFPYTTLFRSGATLDLRGRARRAGWRPSEVGQRSGHTARGRRAALPGRLLPAIPERSRLAAGNIRRERLLQPAFERSEEHTSELQSLTNLVCR